jgi:hypothetical protein
MAKTSITQKSWVRSGALFGLKLQADSTAFVTYSLVAGVSTQDRQTAELGLATM